MSSSRFFSNRSDITSSSHLQDSRVTDRISEFSSQSNTSHLSRSASSMTITRPSTRATISRPSTSRLTSRPNTASGRKSRATTASSILGLSDTQLVVCAVSEARGVTPAVGVAFVDISHGEVILSQICDNQSYVKTIHKIQMAAPSRIVFMATACPPNRPSTLYSLVERLIPDAQVDSFDRSNWSETAGLEYVQELSFFNDIEPLKVAITGKFYATSSFAAIMKFIEHNFSINFSPHSLRIRYRPSEETMMIDISAIQSLEIMQNLQNNKSKDCLFGLLNQTSTPMGSRMLRSNIIQPPTRLDLFITPRYDSLEELTANEEMVPEVRKALKHFHDVEKLLTKLIIIPTNPGVAQVEEQINQVLMIKSFLEAVPDLYRALYPATSVLLTKVRDLCQPDITVPILLSIRKTIEPDVTYMKSALDLRNQRTFAVRSGISGMLDVARQTYKELTEEIHHHVDEVNQMHGLSVSLRFDNGRKYWLRINASDMESAELPNTFINAIRKKDKIECQTLALVKLNARLCDAYNEVVISSDSVIDDLVRELRQKVPDLFKICESVALIDMITAFAQLASIRDYSRPDITGTLALQAARHPILDKTLSGNFVPNDYYSSEQYRFHVITGCNMSGKSTYIRAVALLQIMVQIGSFVPAAYASFPIVHNIFARVSLDDNIEANLSSFSVEMREMAFILRNVDQKSIAIVDELGRGTSTRDGLAIAIAMSEALIQSKASVWFATHFVDLARVLSDRPGVLNLHLAAQTSTTESGLPHLTMLYKATSGNVDDEEHYGIHLAKALGMPASFIEKATQVAKALRERRKAAEQSSTSRKVAARRKLVLHLYNALLRARDSGAKEALPGYLKRLQEEFILQMEEVDSM